MRGDDLPEPRLYPSWKQAQQDLLLAGLSSGQVITDEWLDHAFGIKPAATIPQHERNKLVRLSQFSNLRDSLLQNHQLMLRRIDGGYEVIAHARQVGVAFRDGQKEIKRALQRMTLEIANVRVDALTDDQRKEQANAMASVGALKAMFRKVPKLAAPKTK